MLNADDCQAQDEAVSSSKRPGRDSGRKVIKLALAASVIPNFRENNRTLKLHEDRIV